MAAEIDRKMSLRIEPAATKGFIIWEAGEIVAGLSTRAEVANWIEDRLGSIPGEQEQEAADLVALREDLPNITKLERSRPGWQWRRP